MPIIEVNHLIKEYQLGHITSLKENVLNTFRFLTRKPLQQRENFKALDDVNFTIEQGEVVGIIGHNGAGKSTLLKHLANISKPTKGKVIVRGSVAPLIEVGAGVNPELTGRENIFLNGAILGIPKKIIQKKLDEIIDFSELEQFIDTPVKRYSSGMTVKLGFSIATSMDADILIVDEVLSVGDLAFQRKCFDRMEDMIKRQRKTVLLVTHNVRQVERLCSRAILLDHGTIFIDDLPEKVCDIYFERSDEKIKAQIEKKSAIVSSSDEFELIDLAFMDAKNQRIDKIESNSNTVISMQFKVKKELQNPTFGIGIHTPDLLYLATLNSENDVMFGVIAPGNYELRCDIKLIPLLPGIYSLRAGVTESDAARAIFYAENLFHFQIIPRVDSPLVASARDGFISLSHSWSLNSSHESTSVLRPILNIIDNTEN